MNLRHEVLRATSEAARVFAELPQGRRTSFDIVGAVARRKIPVLFRPLDGLWGAFIAIDQENRGIIVTTKLSLAVQRYTLAHELGHLLLGHESSLDETIDHSARDAPGPRSTAEVAANTFAAELLGSKRLVLASAVRHRWNRQALHQPENVYQLALRLGISYQAACWALFSSSIVSRVDASRLQAMPVRDCKLALTSRDLMSHSWVDVWSLSRADTGTFLEAGPDDLFAVSVQDHTSSGYLWQLVHTGADAEVVDERCTVVDNAYGKPFSRVVYVRFRAPGVHRLQFEHVRPWSGTKVETIDVEIDAFGKEQDGFPRRVKSMTQAST